jgi:hypothetical protein
MKVKFSRQIFEKAEVCSRVVPCGQTDMAKLIVAFRNFVSAPKNDPSVNVATKKYKVVQI